MTATRVSESEQRSVPASETGDTSCACGADRADDAAFCRRCGRAFPMGSSSVTASAVGMPEQDATTDDATSTWSDTDADDPTVVERSSVAASSQGAEHTAVMPPNGRAVADADTASRRRGLDGAAVVIIVFFLVAIGGLVIVLMASGDDSKVAAVPDPAAAGTVSTSAVEIPTPSSSVIASTTAVPSTPAPATTLAEGDLGIVKPITQLPCDGRFVTIYRTSIDDGSNPTFAADVSSWIEATMLDVDLGAEGEYALTRTSCSSLVPDIDGNDVYIVFLGPSSDVVEACAYSDALVNSGLLDDGVIPYVRQMSADVLPGDDIACGL